jgi:hypothetical protein
MHIVSAPSALLQTAPESRSLLGAIVSNFPTDPASIVTLLIGAGAVAAVLWFGRTKGDGTKHSG